MVPVNIGSTPQRAKTKTIDGAVSLLAKMQQRVNSVAFLTVNFASASDNRVSCI